MKTKNYILCCILGLLNFVLSAQAQGTFQNLNFESAANLPVLNPPSSTALVPIADALPSWIGYVNGTNQQTVVIYNGLSGGAAAISLITSNTANSAIGPIGGNYTAALSAGTYLPLIDTVPTAIAQSSLVPVSAQSLRFSAAGRVSDLAVTFNGQQLPFYQLIALPAYVIYGCDASTIAGLPGELRFTEHPLSGPFSAVFLDNIQFSNQPIPEPSALGLFVLGALLFDWRWRKTRKP